MLFHGIEKFSLVDFDGYTSCTLFTGRCNYRCPFCHNAALVACPESEPVIDIGYIDDYLRKRVGVLDAVCITGGEPTLCDDLPEFIAYVKSFGYRVKLDSNGTNPKMLKNLLDRRLIDYAAIDIKNSRDMYPLTTGVKNPHYEKVLKSAELLISAHKSHGFDFEFRTTLVDGLHTEDDFLIIGNELKGAPKFFLQKFVDKGGCLTPGLRAVDVAEARRFADVLREYIPVVKLRGYED